MAFKISNSIVTIFLSVHIIFLPLPIFSLKPFFSLFNILTVLWQVQTQSALSEQGEATREQTYQ